MKFNESAASLKRSYAICLILVLALSTRAMAQASDHELHPVSIGALGGTWSIGAGSWPFFLLTGDVRLSRPVVVGVVAGAVSRPQVLCSEGIDDPMCDRTKLIRLLGATARYEFGAQRLRPYAGVTVGRTWYFNTGTLVGLHGGLSYTAGSRINLRLDGALQTTAERGGLGGAMSLQAGLSVVL